MLCLKQTNCIHVLFTILLLADANLSRGVAVSYGVSLDFKFSNELE